MCLEKSNLDTIYRWYQPSKYGTLKFCQLQSSVVKIYFDNMNIFIIINLQSIEASVLQFQFKNNV